MMGGVEFPVRGGHRAVASVFEVLPAGRSISEARTQAMGGRGDVVPSRRRFGEVPFSKLICCSQIKLSNAGPFGALKKFIQCELT